MAAASEATNRSAYQEALSALDGAARSILGTPSHDRVPLIERVPTPARVVALVAQAYVEWLVGGLRYFGRAGISSAAYGRVLAWQLGAVALGQGGHGVRVLVDESVAQLRELGELTVQEALALQKLLRELSEELRQLEDETLDAPRRYARAKP